MPLLPLASSLSSHSCRTDCAAHWCSTMRVLDENGGSCSWWRKWTVGGGEQMSSPRLLEPVCKSAAVPGTPSFKRGGMVVPMCNWHNSAALIVHVPLLGQGTVPLHLGQKQHSRPEGRGAGRGPQWGSRVSHRRQYPTGACAAAVYFLVRLIFCSTNRTCWRTTGSYWEVQREVPACRVDAQGGCLTFLKASL